MRKISMFFLFAILLSAVFMLGCASQGNNPNGNNGGSMNNTSTAPVQTTENPIVVFETTKGVFKAEIYTDKAPITGKNFISLVNSGFYNGLTFHRYVPGFVIQGGDPKGDGTGGSNKTIPLEVRPDLKHVAGALGMARATDPNSASSQFYVALADLPQLDMQYAVFGQVVQGFDVVQQLRQGDRMTRVYVQH
ncbi:MAG: peptidylprolyl isomerase [Candidatus Micrarchaeia archaeon]